MTEQKFRQDTCNNLTDSNNLISFSLKMSLEGDSVGLPLEVLQKTHASVYCVERRKEETIVSAQLSPPTGQSLPCAELSPQHLRWHA
jgi:hypothetical protein